MCRECDTKMVYVSTSRIHAESVSDIGGDFSLAPRSPYAASGRGVPLGEPAEMMAGYPAGVAVPKKQPGLGEPSRMVGDGSRAAALTRWETKVDLCEGIGRTRAWKEAAAAEERGTG